jgi:hypothetical protein
VSTVATDPAQHPDTLAVLLERVQRHRTAAGSWLVDRIDDTGRPEGADTRNAWWRAPWALAIAGAPDAAAAMLGWAENNALQDDGDFRPGPARTGIVDSPVYGLSPLAIASWLLARYDTARTINEHMRTYQDPATGGVQEYRHDQASPRAEQDTLKTCQLGISALVTGDTASAAAVADWLRVTYQLQPELPNVYYPRRSGQTLLTDYPAERALVYKLDLQAPKQLYFHTGIAAAFLAGWAQQTGDPTVLALGRDHLALNTGGTSAQFDDTTSVQICKYGWGAAAMLAADPAGGHLPAVTRMATWFCDRQHADGSWAPSSFMTPSPGILDHYWKTAEHTMELAYIEQALRNHMAGPRSAT